MKARNRLGLLLLMMTFVAIGTASVTFVVLYRTGYDQATFRLIEEAQTQARMIEAMARFAAVQTSDYPGGSLGAVLVQIRESHEGFGASGKSFEFVVGRRAGDEIEFLLSRRRDVLTDRAPIDLSSARAEPMRRALSGESGSARGLDYRGVPVLAAFEPLPKLGLGVVAKIDLAEVRAPFIRAALLSAGAAILLVLIGSVVYYRVGLAVLRDLQDSERRLREAEHVGGMGSYDLDITLGVWTDSEELDRVLGIGPDYPRTIEGWLELVHPDDRGMMREYWTTDVLADHGRFDKAYRIRRSDDGVERWVHGLGELHFDDAGAPVGLVGTIRDVTEEKAREARLTLKARRAEALLQLPDLFESLDEHPFLRRALEVAEDLTGSEVSFFHRVDEGRRFIELITASGRTLDRFDHATHDERDPVTGGGIWTEVVSRHDAVVVNDLAESAEQQGPPGRHERVSRLMSVPVIEDGEVVAIISLGDKENDYASDDVETARLIAQEAWQLVERGRAEADLAATHAIVNRSPAVAIRWRNEEGWPIEFVSENVEEILGYAAEEFLSGALSYDSIIHPDDQGPDTPEDLRPVASTGRSPASREYRVLTKTGEVRWIEDRVWVKRDAKDEITHYEGVVLDVTDRRAAEERLRASERQSTLILETVRDMVFYVAVEPDGGFRFAAVNSAFLQATGLAKEEIIGRRIEEVIPDPPLELVKAHYREAIGKGAPVTWGQEIGYPKGIGYGVITVAPVLDETGRSTHLVGSVHDVTERRLAEAALRTSEERFRTLFEQVPVAVWEEDFSEVVSYLEDVGFREIEDFPGYLERHPEVVAECASLVRVIDLNDAAVVLHQAGSRQELRNRLTATLTAESYAAFASQLAAIWRGESHVETEAAVRTLAGEVRHTMIRWAATSEAEPPWSRILLSMADITELEVARRELERMNARLEEEVEARTAELRAANEELEGFAYSVSHDLKAPLRAIDGFSALLEETQGPSLSAEGRRLVRTVRESTQQMARLIDDLLEFSRVARAETVIADVDMTRLVRSVFSQLMMLEGERSVDLSVEKLPTVKGDLSLLRQVWLNLVGNALKFSRDRDVARIEIDHAEANGDVVFRIRDNGVGFDMTYADKLFGVFQRLHYSDEFPGSGVGLATVRRIVQRHGGDVWAEGEVDNGATVSFRLPRGGAA
jgi:PAS domain S-box-containing protein